MTLQTTYLLSTAEFDRLEADPDALVGRLAVYIGKDGRVIMTRLGTVEAVLNGAQFGREYVLGLPFEKMGEITIMGIAVGREGEPGDQKVVGRLVDWEGAIPQHRPGSLFVFDDYAELPESSRKSLFDQNLRMFWMRARWLLGGDMPWRSLRFNETPLDLIGKSLGYISAPLPRPLKGEEAQPMDRDTIVGIFRASGGRVGVFLRTEQGTIVEITHKLADGWSKIVNNESSPVVVSFPI